MKKMVLALALMAATDGSAAAGDGDPWIGLILGANGRFGGVAVREVVDGSPAQSAHLSAGDEVLSVNDHSTETAAALIAEVKRAGIGATATLRLVDAKGHTRVVSLKLAPKPDLETLQRTQLVGRAAPDFQPAVLSGAKVPKLSAWKGQVVLIDFFATWCGPCMAALPHVEELHERLGAHGLRVLGVSTESPATVQRLVNQLKLKYTVASDVKEEVSGKYNVFALPTMIVIDRQGVVREVSVADLEAVDAALAAALK